MCDTGEIPRSNVQSESERMFQVVHRTVQATLQAVLILKITDLSVDYLVSERCMRRAPEPAGPLKDLSGISSHRDLRDLRNTFLLRHCS